MSDKEYIEYAKELLIKEQEEYDKKNQSPLNITINFGLYKFLVENAEKQINAIKEEK